MGCNLRRRDSTSSCHHPEAGAKIYFDDAETVQTDRNHYLVILRRHDRKTILFKYQHEDEGINLAPCDDGLGLCTRVGYFRNLQSEVLYEAFKEQDEAVIEII